MGNVKANKNTNGNRKLSVGVQNPQTSCLNLDLPYSFEGIGLSYNYVENLWYFVY